MKVQELTSCNHSECVQISEKFRGIHLNSNYFLHIRYLINLQVMKLHRLRMFTVDCCKSLKHTLCVMLQCGSSCRAKKTDLARLYLITGLDCWTGLMDWITGLNLFMSHDFHTIKCRTFVYSNCLITCISCTSSSHWMVGNEHERTMYKLNGRLCTISS